MLKLNAGTAIQRPVTLSGQSGEINFSGTHIFFGLEYFRRTNGPWSWGLGGTISWTSYRFKTRIDITDPGGGRQEIRNVTWSPFIWYPFERGQLSRELLQVDPFQFMFLFKRENRNFVGGRYETSFMVGLMPMITTDWGWGVPVRETYSNRIAAEGTIFYGSHINPFIGGALQWVKILPSSDNLSIGVDVRISLNKYYTHHALFNYTPSYIESVSKNNHFVWVGLRSGYVFTWGPPRKPRWMKRLERDQQ